MRFPEHAGWKHCVLHTGFPPDQRLVNGVPRAPGAGVETAVDQYVRFTEIVVPEYRIDAIQPYFCRNGQDIDLEGVHVVDALRAI